MGCDIHSFAEIKIKGWHLLRDEFENPWFDPSAKDDFAGKRKHIHPIDNRNYDAFAILANVRNGSGFAGVDTGDGFKVISEPKGLPNDMSHALKSISEDEDSDFYLGDHSFSWLTLQELLDFDWSLDTIQRGVVGVDRFIAALENNGVPTSYSGGVFGPKITHVPFDEMKQRIDTNDFENGRDNYYTQLEWPESYKDSSGELWSATIPRLQEIAEHKHLTHDEIRMVFGFDS